MAAAIAADTPDGQVLSVLALLDGAFMFCADLVRRLPMPVRVALEPVRSVRRGGDPRRLELPQEFPVEGDQLPPIRRFKYIGEGYHAVMGNQLLAGRAITAAEIEDRAQVVMVTADLASDYWATPAGRRRSVCG